jgi:phosphohistidine phosphatase
MVGKSRTPTQAIDQLRRLKNLGRFFDSSHPMMRRAHVQSATAAAPQGRGSNVKVILIRHGDAEADIPEGLQDDARALTARARNQLPAHFQALAARIGTPDVIFMSPLVRAVQTATLFAQALAYAGPLKAHRHLYPDGPVGAIEAVLYDQRGKTVVLVGHQPTIGVAAAHFLGMAGFAKAVVPGTAIGIERPDQNPTVGRLLFYAAPGQPVSEG